MMQALTLWDPWAWAMAYAGKPVENRTWVPPRQAIGQMMAIHAGKTCDREAILDIATELGIAPENWTPTEDEATHLRICGCHSEVQRKGRLVPGAVVAVGVLAGVVCNDRRGYIAPGMEELIGRPSAEILRLARESSWYNGPVGWLIVNRIALPQPVPCRGAQGLWTLPRDIEEQVRAQI